VGDHHETLVLELRLQVRDRRFFLCTIHGSPPCTEVYMEPKPLKGLSSGEPVPEVQAVPALVRTRMVNGSTPVCAGEF
jgi:hypothetical protein